MQCKVSLGIGFIIPALLLGPAGLADTVTVDGSRTYQVIEGFGANINHRSWNPNELPPVLNALIDQAGMTLFRVILDKPDCESTNDNSDPAVMNWDYYNQLYSSADFQKLWDITAYLNHKGIVDGVMYNFQGPGPVWMVNTDNALLPGYEAEWAEMSVALLKYARSTRHLQFSLVAPCNEADGWHSFHLTSAQHVVALHTLAQLLDANGLGDLRFVGPDGLNTSTDWLAAMMADPVIMAKLAHFGVHAYEGIAGGSAGVRTFLQQSPYPDRTFWVTEFNEWCTSCENGGGGTNSWAYASGTARYLLSHLANSASAALIWEGYDSQYNYYLPGQWSYWGLFFVDDTNAVPKTYTPRKIFYALAQITKFVRPGALRITLSSGTTYALAFHHPDSGQLTITGLNTNHSVAALSGILTNLPPVASLDLYYTDSTTNLCHSATVPITNGSFTASVPANCVFALVGLDPARIAVSVLLTNPPDGACYPAPATIPIQAIATTRTGSISQVTFYCGTTNLGAALDEPHSITWSNVPAGTYLLSARATNSFGNNGVSPGVRIAVAGPMAGVAVTPTNTAIPPYGTQQFTATAIDALGTAVVPQPPLSWSASGGTINASGFFTGGSVAGTFAITASTGGSTGNTYISITTNLNLAPAGTGFTWYSLTSATNKAPQITAPGINDGDLDSDIKLAPGGPELVRNLFEAAGVVWPTPQTIGGVLYRNGSYTPACDGVFGAEFGLQFSPDGATWTNAGPAWTVTPSYAYNSPAAAHVSFAFRGGVAAVRGVRCVGRVHIGDVREDSWCAFVTEVQAFAASLPLPVLAASNAPTGVALSWPAPLTSYTLEAATNLVPPVSWSEVTNTPQQAGDLLTVTVPSTPGLQFFRLRQF